MRPKPYSSSLPAPVLDTVLDTVDIPNSARRTLDAYERFHTGYPCWSENNTDKYKFMSTDGLAWSNRDGLWHFSTRP